MKKAKRIIALILALALIFAFMAMSVSAATTEVQPRGYTCDNCGGSYNISGDKYYVSAGSVRADTCSYNSISHTHPLRKVYREILCATCGNVVGSTYITTQQQCPYYGWY